MAIDRDIFTDPEFLKFVDGRVALAVQAHVDAAHQQPEPAPEPEPVPVPEWPPLSMRGPVGNGVHIHASGVRFVGSTQQNGGWVLNLSDVGRAHQLDWCDVDGTDGAVGIFAHHLNFRHLRIRNCGRSRGQGAPQNGHHLYWRKGDGGDLECWPWPGTEGDDAMAMHQYGSENVKTDCSLTGARFHGRVRTLWSATKGGTVRNLLTDVVQEDGLFQLGWTTGTPYVHEGPVVIRDSVLPDIYVAGVEFRDAAFVNCRARSISGPGADRIDTRGLVIG